VNERPEGPGNNGDPEPQPTPRDLPDEQAAAEEDPLDVVGSMYQGTQPDSADGLDFEVPDTDEGGTARRGAAPHGESPGHDAPEESPA
jgi:hypothetical protein